MNKAKSVEEYIELHDKWSDVLNELREIILKTELEETVKWGAPTYTINGKNVVGLGAFKHHYGLWFHNGVFLKDEHGLLINAQEGKTKALRQMRFEEGDKINESVILQYLKEAIVNQKAGKEIKPERKSGDLSVPSLLQEALNDDALKQAFEGLTPYKQKEYCEYIETAKRDATKQSRLEKITPMILQGIGLNDKYRNC